MIKEGSKIHSASCNNVSDFLCPDISWYSIFLAHFTVYLSKVFFTELVCFTAKALIQLTMPDKPDLTDLCQSKNCGDHTGILNFTRLRYNPTENGWWNEIFLVSLLWLTYSCEITSLAFGRIPFRLDEKGSYFPSSGGKIEWKPSTGFLPLPDRRKIKWSPKKQGLCKKGRFVHTYWHQHNSPWL